MSAKNKAAVHLGRQSAKVRRAKLGEDGFRKQMKDLRAKQLKDKKKK